MQGHARAILSFEPEVEQVSATVEVVPYITVYPNSTFTSWSTLQRKATLILDSNATSVLSDFADLSTELTWEHDGLTLTYPTTYVSYVWGQISGGTPLATSTSAGVAVCDRADLDALPIVTPPPQSVLVYPIDQARASMYPYSLPDRLIDFIAAQPGVTSVFGLNDLHTCTQSHPGFAFFTVSEPVAVAKTSVLVLTTQTGNAVIKTADATKAETVPAGGGIPADTPPPPAGHVEDASSGPLIAPAAENQVDSTSSVAQGIAGAVLNALFSTPTTPAGSLSQGDLGTIVATPAPGTAGGLNTPGAGIANAILGAIGNTATSIAQQVPQEPPANLGLGDSVVTVNSAGNIVFGSVTISAGGPALTVGANIVSLSVDSAGSTIAIVNGGTSSPRSGAATGVPSNSQVLSVNAAGGVVIGSSTINVGGPAVTVGSSTFSLATNSVGSVVVVVNGRTSSLNEVPLTQSLITSNGQTFTLLIVGTSTLFVASGLTLTPGQIATIGGGTITAPNSIPSSTAASANASRSSTVTLPTPTSGGGIYEGGAVRVKRGTWAIAMFVCGVVLLFC